jgi:hypothetical protein
MPFTSASLLRQTTLAIATSTLCLAAQAQANLAFNPMPAGINPVIDGAVTQPLPASPGAAAGAEWSSSNVSFNNQQDGTYRAEWQRDWAATSVQTGNQSTYNGVTLFVQHDLWGYTTHEAADYNVFEFALGNLSVKAWVFASGDDANDAGWIGHSGLGYNQVDDRGFIVRLNGNPATDIHWLPGDPEPGDAGWNWNTTYGFFGRAGFNDSAFATGQPLSVNGLPNEVYEVALFGGTGLWSAASGGGFIPCTTTINLTVTDPKNGSPALPLQTKVQGFAHVMAAPVPEPSSWAMAIAGLGLVGAMGRLRRQRQL